MFEELDIYICKIRSFCFGVINAIEKVEKTLEEFGTPIYVLHEIVHNKHIIENLQKKGVIFIEDIKDCDPKRPLIFSAHGVANHIVQTADKLKIEHIDATCPLVTKVHKKIAHLEEKDYQIIIIGKKTHQEIIGTIGQLQNPNNVHIVSCLNDVLNLNIDETKKTGFVTQTTLSVDETSQIVSILKNKFKNIETLDESDICLATTQRQKNVKDVAKLVDLMIVIGSKNSSNSCKLAEVSLEYGAKKSILIDDESELNIDDLSNISSLGITAGASAPEYLIKDLIKKLETHYKKINIKEI